MTKSEKPSSLSISDRVKHFDELPDSALICARDVAMLVGVTPSTVASRAWKGKFPRSVYRGAYRVGDVRAAMAGKWVPEKDR